MTEDVDLSKTQPYNYFAYSGNPSQDWKVNYANSNILWHFLTAVIWHMKDMYM